MAVECKSCLDKAEFQPRHISQRICRILNAVCTTARRAGHAIYAIELSEMSQESLGLCMDELKLVLLCSLESRACECIVRYDIHEDAVVCTSLSLQNNQTLLANSSRSDTADLVDVAIYPAYCFTCLLIYLSQ